MVKKISLRERVRLWKTEKVWLLAQDCGWFEKYGMQSYDAVNSNGLHTSIWAAEENLGKVKLTKLSNKYNNIAKLEVPEGLYIFGTEGVFFKKNAEGLLQHIHNGDFYKAVIYPDVSKIKIFLEDESHYIVGRLEAGKFIIEGEGEESTEIPRYLRYEIIVKRGNI